MKKQINIVILLVQVFYLKAQINVDWTILLSGNKNDAAQSICQSGDGGYYVLANSNSTKGDLSNSYGGNNEIWILKISGLGIIMWKREIGGYGNTIGYDIHESRDSGCIISAYTNSKIGMVRENNEDNLCLIKLTKQGIIQWYKTFGGRGSHAVFAVQETTSNGFVAVGEVFSNDNIASEYEKQNILVMRLSEKGDTEWETTLGGSQSESVSQILQTKDGGFIFIGYTNSNDGNITENHGYDDIWVVKLGRDGKIEWQKTYGGSNPDRGYSIKETNDGGYAIVGETWSNDGDLTANNFFFMSGIWVIKLSNRGNIVWQRVVESSEFGMGMGKNINQNYKGEYVVVGTISRPRENASTIINEKVKIFKLSKLGETLWEVALPSNTTVNSTLFIDENTLIVVGSYSGEENDKMSLYGDMCDMFISKLALNK